jgi:hypothetical protein
MPTLLLSSPVKGALMSSTLCAKHPVRNLRSNNSEPCERQTLGDHTAPANPVGLEPNPEHMLAAAMNPRRNEPIFAGAMPVTQSHVYCNSDFVKSRTYRVGPGRKGRNFKSTSQTSWTKDLDEHVT